MMELPCDGETLTYLGMQWTRDESSIVVHMDSYINNLPDIQVQRASSAHDSVKLVETEARDFKSLLMKVRWPVSHVIPSLAYKVSSLTQGSRDEITVGTHKELNRLVRAPRALQVNRVPV